LYGTSSVIITTMKVALLLPGYLDSPDYLHMMTFEKGLKKLGYTTERLDPCGLWKTGDIKNYTITNYIKQIEDRVDTYKKQNPSETVLIGHSMGGFVSIIAGSKISEVSKIVSLCSPPDRLGSAEDWEGKEYRHSKRDLPGETKKFKTFDVPQSFAEDGLQYSAVEEVKKMHKPLMIFIALEDTVCPPELTEKIVAHANSPYVVRQPGMGHDFRHSRKECDIVWRRIQYFLTSKN
jgi:esterase/lipase